MARLRPSLRSSKALQRIQIPSKAARGGCDFELHRLPDGSLMAVQPKDFTDGLAGRMAFSPVTGEKIVLGYLSPPRVTTIPGPLSSQSWAILEELHEIGRNFKEVKFGKLLLKKDRTRLRELLSRGFVGIWSAPGVRIYHITRAGQTYYQQQKGKSCDTDN